MSKPPGVPGGFEGDGQAARSVPTDWEGRCISADEPIPKCVNFQRVQITNPEGDVWQLEFLGGDFLGGFCLGGAFLGGVLPEQITNPEGDVWRMASASEAVRATAPPNRARARDTVEMVLEVVIRFPFGKLWFWILRNALETPRLFMSQAF